MKPDSLIKSLTKITPDQAKALERIGLKTLTDVLYYFPVRYSNVGTITVLDNAQADTEITVYGVLSKISLTKGWKSKIPMAKASLRDMSDTNISIIWMHQPYMAKMFAEGDQVKLTGKISEGKNGRIFMNPHIEKTGYLPVDVSDSLFENTDDAKDVGFPIYRETRGITSKWIYHTVKRIFAENIHRMISDPLPDSVLKKFHLPDLKTALVWMHMPEKKEHADAAQKRFAFQEIFLIHVQKAFERKQYQQLFSFKLNVPKKDVQDFIDTFPFEPTTGQMDALGSYFPRYSI
jgi:ATP-dependent DNA helicase RecG